MAIQVNIPVGEASVTIDPLYQWDYGQVLKIESGDALPAVFEVHFSCLDMSDAIVRSCSSSNGFTVEVPNTCLEQAYEITAWIYEIDETSGKTLKTIIIPIIARPRPNRGGEISESTADAYTEVISAINRTVEELKNGEITVKKAETATSAGTAQNAHEADTSTKLSSVRSMVYVKLSYTVDNVYIKIYFSFVSKELSHTMESISDIKAQLDKDGYNEEIPATGVYKSGSLQLGPLYPVTFIKSIDAGLRFGYLITSGSAGENWYEMDSSLGATITVKSIPLTQ